MFTVCKYIFQLTEIDNDPSRGTQVALLAASSVLQRNISCAVGISTGTAFCGLVSPTFDEHRFILLGGIKCEKRIYSHWRLRQFGS